MPGQVGKQQQNLSFQASQQRQRRSRQPPLSDASKSLKSSPDALVMASSLSSVPINSFGERSRTLECHVAATAPTPSIRYEGLLEPVEMSQLSSSQDWGAGSISSSSRRSNKNDLPLGQNTLSASSGSRSSNDQHRGIAPSNHQCVVTSAVNRKSSNSMARSYTPLNKNIALRWTPNVRMKSMVTPPPFHPLQNPSVMQQRGLPATMRPVQQQQCSGGRNIAHGNYKVLRADSLALLSFGASTNAKAHHQGSGPSPSLASSTGTNLSNQPSKSNGTAARGHQRFDCSQTSHSLLSSQTASAEAVFCDTKSVEAYNENLNHKMKELDDQQHAFHRLVATIEDQQAEYLSELDRKVKDQQLAYQCSTTTADDQHSTHIKELVALKDQLLAELAVKASSLDRQLNDAHDQHKARTSELDKMNSKVVDLIKTFEASVLMVKDLATSSVAAAMNQTRSILIESALPFLKKPVLEMVTTVLHGSHFTSLQKASSIPPPTITKTPKCKDHNIIDICEVEDSVLATKPKIVVRDNKAATRSHQSAEHATFKRKATSKANVSAGKKFKTPEQARTLFLPCSVADIESDKMARATKFLLSPAYTTHSCITPCNTKNMLGSVVDTGMRTPVTNKRCIQHAVKSQRAKKVRGRFGRERTAVSDNDDESKYSFLSG